jgi:hypothetical protein
MSNSNYMAETLITSVVFLAAAFGVVSAGKWISSDVAESRAKDRAKTEMVSRKLAPYRDLANKALDVAAGDDHRLSQREAGDFLNYFGTGYVFRNDREQLRCMGANLNTEEVSFEITQPWHSSNIPILRVPASRLQEYIDSN